LSINLSKTISIAIYLSIAISFCKKKRKKEKGEKGRKEDIEKKNE